MWDATCPDMLVSSYCCQATSTAGKEFAFAAEERKACKYAMLGQAFCFVSLYLSIFWSLEY